MSLFRELDVSPEAERGVAPSGSESPSAGTSAHPTASHSSSPHPSAAHTAPSAFAASFTPTVTATLAASPLTVFTARHRSSLRRVHFKFNTDGSPYTRLHRIRMAR